MVTKISELWKRELLLEQVNLCECSILPLNVEGETVLSISISAKSLKFLSQSIAKNKATGSSSKALFSESKPETAD